MSWVDVEQQVRQLISQASGPVGVEVRELPSGAGFSIDAQERFSSASLIKVPVLVAAIQQAERGFLSLSQRVPVAASPNVGGSGILASLSDVSELSVRDLVELMITISDNLATNLLIQTLTPAVIAETIDAAGLQGTVLQRSMMDLAARERGLDNFTTAADMTVLMREIACGTTIFANPPSYRIAREVLERQQVNDRLPRALPDGWTLAHKTGELDGVRHDAGFVTVGGQPVLAIAVLTEGFGTPPAPDAYGEQAADLVAQIGRLSYSAVTI
jgi:beta-lactamase class A